MQVGGSGSVKSDINVTPLVDVVLVLLIIFMVLTPVVQMGYLVKGPPKAPANLPPSAVQDQIVLRLASGGRVLINKEEMSVEQFPNRIREVLRGNTSKMVFFSGGRDVDYETTMKLLDPARHSGAAHRWTRPLRADTPTPPARAARDGTPRPGTCSLRTAPAARSWLFLLHELVRVRAGQVEPVHLPQLADLLPRLFPERRFSLEGMQHDAFEEIAEGDVVIFGQAFQHFEQALLHPDAGLLALDRFRYHGTMVPRYQCTKLLSCESPPQQGVQGKQIGRASCRERV